MNTTIHKKGCPQNHDYRDECMCAFIKPKKRNRTRRLLCKAKVKNIAFSFADPRFRRVGKSFFEAVERNANEFIKTRAQAQQRRGVTLK